MLKRNNWHLRTVKEFYVKKEKKSLEMLYFVFQWLLAKNFYHIPNETY